jgi:putative endopeptidase
MMKTNFSFIIGIGLFAILIIACSSETNQTVELSPGIALSYMDTTANPGDDFFRYVNGTWLDNTEIPADRSRWGSFDELRKNTDHDVLKILAKAGESDLSTGGEDQRKAAVFYKTAMDTQLIDRIGIKPLEPYFERIDQVEDVASLQDYLAFAEPYGGGGFFGFGVQPDLKNSMINAAYLGPGDIGLPDRDYYLKDDEESKKIQEQYVQHIARMFGFLGIDDDEAGSKAEKIYQLEKRMAERMLTKEDRRNTPLLYNPRSIEDLKNHTPSVNWEKYLADIGAADVDTVIVTQPKFMEALEDIFNSEPPSAWKDYLTWTGLNSAAAYLNSEIEEANFDFYGKVLNGREQQRPRNERVLQTTNGVIGEALGQLYVNEYFPPEAKEKARELVENLLVAFESRLKEVDWMTDETKEKALAKLKTFNVKIGYPDKWKDYSGLDIKSGDEGGSYIENLLNVGKFNFFEDIDKIGKEVDKTEWFLPPQIVNAYYSPLFNEVVFPAAILQPPFYNYKADDAVNYGGIGAVIGHEISHGFDDQGSRFDKDGNLINWWTDEDRESFNERCQKLIAQFDEYKPFDDLSVNGKFTLGENIGDLGGLNVAYDALMYHYKKSGNKPDLIDGFTPEQRFFLSWGTIWRTKHRDEALRTQINTDPHSPGLYRAFGAPTNMEAFYAAFDIREGDKMYRPDSVRAKIW